jgi:hypothetical protein
MSALASGCNRSGEAAVSDILVPPNTFRSFTEAFSGAFSGTQTALVAYE